MKIKYKLLALVISLSLVICSLITPLAIRHANISKSNKKLSGDYVAGELGNNNISYVVDNNTMDSYKDYLINDKTGSKNAGKIWSDKTVLSSSTLTLDEETDGVSGIITNDSDFLHVYSALGSSKRVSRLESIPLDVVLLIDVSTSMSNHYADAEAIKSANFLIKTLMGDNDDIEYVHPDNRVGIIVYAGGTQVLLPLSHYELEEGQDDFLTLDRVNGNGKYFPKVTTHIKETDKIKNKTSDPMFSDSTYLQGALYQGMYLLATEKNTTYTNPVTNITMNRTPILITLTDGGTNVVGATSTAKYDEKSRIDFWNPLSWTDSSDGKAILPVEQKGNDYRNYIPEANGNPFYTTLNADTANTIPPRTLGVLLTAGYMKNWVEDNYTKNSVDGSDVSMYGFGIGLNVYTQSEYSQLQLKATMDPRKYFTADADNEQIKTSYGAFEKYLKRENPSLVFDDNYKWIGKNIKANWTFNHPTGDAAKYDVTSVEDVYYIDQYMETDTDQLMNVFENMLTTITEQVLKPISGVNDIGIKDYLTYIDPIGEYMEVKDIKNVSLFGKLYNVTKDKLKYYVVNADNSISEYDVKPEKYNYIRQYYKIVPQNGDVQNNLSYKMEDVNGNTSYNVTFNLSSILMYVESKESNTSKIGSYDTSDETLYINIPRNALPLEVAEIQIDENNKVISYSDNLDKYEEATPLRVYYTVGIDSAIKNADGSINLSKVSKEYIAQNTEEVDSKKYISFYANYFSNKQINNSTHGDATISFSPSSDNQYFTSNTPLILYEATAEDKQEKEIILDDASYKTFIKNHKMVNKVDNENSNKYYYIVIDYYMPNEEEICHVALLRQGKEFGTGISGKNISFGEYLCWYSPSANIWKNFSTTKPEDTHTDWVIATKPGGLIAGNMQDELVTKETNNTKTSSSYILPSISESTTGFNDGNNIVINMYQGNNGKLQVLENDLTIKKFVSGDLSETDKEWTIKVTLVAPNNQTLNTSYQTINEDGTKGILSLTKHENKYEGTIKIKDKETITIKDLPNGVQYKLEEIEANQDDYKTTTKGNLEGTLTGENPTIEFYNKKYSYYDLTIEKIVKGETKTDQEFSFEIRLVENPDVPLEENIAYKGTNIEDGIIKFTKDENDTYIGNITLKNNQKITINLPYNTQYEIIEIDANKNGYNTTYENNKGVIDADITVTITNEVIKSPLTLDNSIKYIMLFVTCLVGLVISIFVFRKLRKKMA